MKNEKLNDHGRAGRVVCAAPYKADGLEVVDVQLDGDGADDVTQFEVVDLQVL